MRSKVLFLVVVLSLLGLAGCNPREAALGGAAVGAIVGAAIADSDRDGYSHYRHNRPPPPGYYGSYYNRPPPPGYYGNNRPPPQRYRYHRPPNQNCWYDQYGRIRCR